MKNQKGFTLIELLVVIAIIGVMSALVIVNLSSANKKSRDARRKADISEVRTALELYFDDALGYPVLSRSNISTLTALVPAYIKILPIDPKPATNNYFYTGTASTYTLEALLEKDDTWYTVYSSN